MSLAARIETIPYGAMTAARLSRALALAAVLWAQGGCRPPSSESPVAQADLDACSIILQRSIDEAQQRDAERVYVQTTDPVCAAARERATSAPDVERWRGSSRRKCPGRACGPRDGNPLVIIRHESDGCFRVTTLRWTGGSGSTRCVEPGDAPPLRDVVVY